MKTQSRIVRIVLGVTGLVCVPLRADVLFFQPTDGIWSPPGNWDPPRRPVAGDTVVIAAGKTCRVDIVDAVCHSFDVDGALIINAGQALKISGASTLDGSVRIAAGGELRVDLQIGDVTVSGAGSVSGEGADPQPLPKITLLASGAQFKTQVRVVGRLHLAGNGGFANEGGVFANGHIIIGVTGLLSDIAGDVWVVETPGAKLAMNVGAIDSPPGLQGNFLIGEEADLTSGISFNGSLATAGRLQMRTGTFEVLQGNILMGDDNPQNPKHMDMTGGIIRVAPEGKFTHK